MRHATLFLVASFVAAAAGCATIVAPGPDLVSMTTNPPGAEVRVDDKTAGTTPITQPVERSARLVTFHKEGYEEAIRPVPRTVNPWVFGNILVGGRVGIIVDMSTGNSEMAGDKIEADLRVAPPAPVAASTANPPAIIPARY